MKITIKVILGIIMAIYCIPVLIISIFVSVWKWDTEPFESAWFSLWEFVGNAINWK